MLMFASAIALLAVQADLYMPVGTSEWFQQGVAKVVQLSAENKKAEARALLDRFVDGNIAVEWHDEALSPDLRARLQAERELVFSDWRNSMPKLAVKYVKSGGDLRFDFTNGSEGGVKIDGSTTFDSGPLMRVEMAAGENRGLAAIHNDLSYGFGRYMGLSDLPFPGFIMSHPLVATDRMRPPQLEFGFAIPVFNYVDQLRIRIANGQKLDQKGGTLELKTPSLTSPDVVQGTHPQFSIQLKNVGPGALRYLLIPDCSCFSITGVAPLRAGREASIDVSMDTTEFGGPQHKKLYLVSNDPKAPVTEIPVEVGVIDRYRFLPEKGPLYIVPDGGMKVETYLFFPNDKPFNITSTRVDGMPAEVAVEPWQGDLADPNRKEPASHRIGYKVSVDIKDLPISGRLGTTIRFITDDPTFGQIMYPIFLQKGIMVSPNNVYLGEVGAATEAIFLLTRPGKPFQILSATSSSDHLKVSVDTSKIAADYRVHLIYDGKAPKGTYAATVDIKTDDPKQPVIQVPVTGSIK